MAVRYLNRNENDGYVGLSTDTKPTNADDGAVFTELTVASGLWKKYKSISGVWYEISDDENSVSISSALPTGTNFIGRSGYVAKKASISFTRPSDTNIYAAGDAITNSTSAPSVFEVDLSSLGAVVGQSILIQSVSVVSSVKQATLPLVNVFLSPVTFVATNDNSALSIDDVTMKVGQWINCEFQNYSAVNSVVRSGIVNEVFTLDAADTKLYGTLQVMNAYTPASAEEFTIVVSFALL